MKTSPSQRADQLRKRARRGTATAEEIAELAEFEATKSNRGRKTKEEKGEAEPSDDLPDEKPSEAEPGDEKPSGEKPSGEKPSDEKPADEKTRKRRHKWKPQVPSESDGKGGAWRAKYGAELDVGGREQTCVMVGVAWHKLVMACVGYIEDGGSKSVIPRDQLEGGGGLFILAADDLLPASLVIRPSTAAAVISSVAVGQATLVRYRSKAGKARAKPSEPSPPKAEKAEAKQPKPPADDEADSMRMG